MTTTPAGHGARQVLVLAHTGRASAVSSAEELVSGLTSAGIEVSMMPEEVAQLPEPTAAAVRRADPDDPLDGTELVVVLGGDGTILRAGELTFGTQVPLLGVNLGHVGFLAEAERDDIGEVVARIAGRAYEVEERLTLEVTVWDGNRLVAGTWALNEASIEKQSRERMIEVGVEVDGRPLTSFGCDGIVLATPTGSTAYAFSAGGPVVWPEVEALLMVPLSAHALFARPIVVTPTSTLAVDVINRTGDGAVLWCDGRRSVVLEAGYRVQARRSTIPLRLARLSRPPFTDRLVAKFGLPVHGLRGPVH